MRYKGVSIIWTLDNQNFYHNKGMLEKDTKHPRVFISRNYYYFGDKAVLTPPCFHSLIRERQGAEYNNNQEILEEVINWLDKNYPKGILGDPIDRERPRFDTCRQCHIIS